jgi:hypothetical protein
MSDENSKAMEALREFIRRKAEEAKTLRDQLPDMTDLIRRQQELLEAITGRKLDRVLPEEVRLRTEKVVSDIAEHLADPNFREQFDEDMKKLQAMLDQFAEFHEEHDEDTADDTVHTFH